MSKVSDGRFQYVLPQGLVLRIDKLEVEQVYTPRNLSQTLNPFTPLGLSRLSSKHENILWKGYFGG